MVSDELDALARIQHVSQFGVCVDDFADEDGDVVSVPVGGALVVWLRSYYVSCVLVLNCIAVCFIAKFIGQSTESGESYGSGAS